MNITYRIFIGCAVMILLLTMFAQSLLAKDTPNDPAGYWLSKKKDVVVRIDHSGRGQLRSKRARAPGLLEESRHASVNSTAVLLALGCIGDSK